MQVENWELMKSSWWTQRRIVALGICHSYITQVQDLKTLCLIVLNQI
jgi:hypothetical protein